MAISWKLVRDRNQEQLEGKVPGKWRPCADPVSSLIAKLGEEYGEFAGTRDPEELYDIKDILEELIRRLDPFLYAYERHEMKTDIMGFFRACTEWHPAPDYNLLDRNEECP